MRVRRRGSARGGRPVPAPASSPVRPSGDREVRWTTRRRCARRSPPAAPCSAPTSPNPPVGAVVLDAAGALAGTGATGPARRAARRGRARSPQAGRRARGGTAVVTLEPCRHTGRTGPCTQALLDAGVARVVVACADPTAVAGGGARRLRAAGVEVETGVLADEVAAGPLEAWLHRPAHRPPVRHLEVRRHPRRPLRRRGRHQPLDHRRRARADVHRLRAEADAVLVGIGTVLADDPPLDRPPRPGPPAAAGRARPVRPHPGRARVRDDAAATLVAHRRSRARPLARRSRDRGVASVLLEGGPTLAGAFLRGRAGRPGGRLRRPGAARRRARPRSPTPAWERSPTPSGCA